MRSLPKVCESVTVSFGIVAHAVVNTITIARYTNFVLLFNHTFFGSIFSNYPGVSV